MFTLILHFIIVCFLIINIVFLFFKKFFIYLNNLFEISFFYIVKKMKMQHIIENVTDI